MVGALCRLDMSYNRGTTQYSATAARLGIRAFMPHSRNEIFQAHYEAGQVVFADSLRVLKI